MEKAEASEEQSMEEILQSIKRIIADDEAEEANAAAKKDSDEKESANEEKEDDILELSDFVDGDEKDDTPTESNPLTDLLDEKPAAQNEPETEKEVMTDKKEEKPTASAADADDILASIDGLLNAEVAQASSSAMQELKKLNQTQTEIKQPQVTGSISFRSGITVEDLVVEMLKPELKEWLNNNLPQIVEKLVQAEIKKISQG